MMQFKKRTFFHPAFCLVILIAGVMLAPIGSGAGGLKSSVKPEPLSNVWQGKGSLGSGSSPTTLFFSTDDAATRNAPFSVLASSCVSGQSLFATDPTYNRVITQSLGTGFGTCTLSASGNAVHYNTYQFNLTGCASFPTQVVITTCPQAATGTAPGCTTPASNTDTVINLYRSGGSLTAGTGTAAPFNPASACTNLVALNDDIDTAEIAAGGSTCDQLTPFTCHPSCGGNTSTSGMYRSLGPGFFNVVVSGFGNATLGTYNLFVNAPGAGCSIANSPTAAPGEVTGRIVDNNGASVEGAVIRLDGAQNRKFITDANGFYRFDNVAAAGFYTVTPSRVNYTFSPATRSFSLLGDSVEAVFNASSTGGFVNPLDTPEYFVRQHYIDFLGREPDEAGFNFWSDQIIECGTDNTCIERRRENVSAAYFLSIEFQQTGGLVDRMYRASYGVRPEFAQFMPDTRAVGQGVVVGNDGWQAKLQANKQAFVNAFVNRATFVGVYGNMDNSLFVDALISHTGVTFTASERDALTSGLATGAMTRADVLRSIAENDRFVSAKLNEAFVMMEYFGYLRRDPDASGYAFWLNKLSEFNGNFEQAEMVKAFIVSGEYRDGFPR